MAGWWYAGLGSKAIPTCSCLSAKLAASTNVFHSAPVTLAGSAGMKGGIWMRCAISVDWAAPVTEVVRGPAGICLARGSWLWEGVENPSLMFAAPTEGDPIEF